ncbi:MAG: [acyl-carrier-protein] S-malonyltransferase, partial [Candidatus Electrothrix sp. ATG1]|nr:[acyl-carrier-protein] S-malonyltransferase [Candidatus Electrothrix sp. ATG1]
MKKTAILFPGQGSQYNGMGQALIEADQDAAALMEMAENVSGFPLKKLCFEGPMEDLTRVLHLQPAMTAVNLICWQQLKKALPDFTPAYAGGHSLGEYSALQAAGVLSAEDTMTLVTKRGELMEREGAANPGGMLALLGLTIAEVDELLNNYSGAGVVVVANHNAEQQIIISGDQQGLDGFSEICRENGAKKVIPLKVSVANHSPLVAGAVDDFSASMAEISFQAPNTPVLFNVTAAPETEPATIRDIIARQIASRVRWYESINRMIEDEVEVFVELGPKTVLTGMMRKILPRKSPVTCVQADTPEGLEKVIDII